MTRSRLGILLTLLLVSGVAIAARVLKLEPGETGESQAVIWSGGTPYLVSDVVHSPGNGSRIIVAPAAPDYRRRQRVSFYLTVINHSPDMVEINYEDIHATNEAGEELVVVTGDMAREEIRDSAARARFAQALAASLQAYGQTYSALSSGVSQFEVNRAQRQDQLETQARQNAITQTAESSLELTALYFGRTTVFPSESYTSFIDVHPPNRRGRTDKVILDIQVGQDSHQLEFDYVELD